MQPGKVQLLLLFIFGAIHIISGHNVSNVPANFTESILGRADNDPQIRPGSPTTVYVGFYINSISSIDEMNMDYTLSIYLRQSWLDPRLAFTEYNESLTLNFDQTSRIWVPDMFFRNEKRGTFHDITVPNRLLKLSPQGLVLYSQRLSLTLHCEFDLASFPMDRQRCTVEMETYGHTTEELIFKWSDIKEPVQIKENFQLPEFVLEKSDITLDDCTTVYVTGNYSCIYARLELVRQLNYYLIQGFVPTLLIVVLSWVSFWIDTHAVPARISLGLLTVLTMTTQSSVLTSRLPRVGYIKAIDVWMTVCLAFVFCAMLEYSIVIVLSKKEKSPSEKQVDTATNPAEIEIALPTVNGIAPLGERKSSDGSDTPQCRDSGSRARACSWPWLWSCNSACYQRAIAKSALSVDVVSRWLFPLAFFVFIIVYWMSYLPKDGSLVRSWFV